MNEIEKLMAKFPQLNYVFSKKMPKEFKGLCVGNVIYINANDNDTNAQKLVTLSEEIAHYETGVGDITEQEKVSDRKQENKARRLGSQRLVTLDQIISCWKKGFNTIEELAEELGVTPECIESAIESYRIKKGLSFHYKNYRIKFNSDTNIQIENQWVE